MKRDLRGMAESPNKTTSTQTQQFTANDMKYMQDMASQYSGRSQNDLLEELMRTAAQEKEKGNLSPAMLEQFFSSISPMLTAEQRTRMASLIEQIK